MNQFPVTEFESFLNDNKKLRMVKNKGPWHIELLPDEKPYHPEVLLKNISNEMYLIADLHIGDPIENWTDKRDKIIATINATVSKDDHLLIVGDLSAHTNTANLDDVRNTIAMLNCRNLYLILGNNDQYDIDTYVKMGFLTVTDKIYWKNYVITHCPIPVYGNQINIHGHMHEEIQYINVDWHNHINIWNDQYVPIKLGKAIELFNSGYYKGITINDKEELEYHKNEKYFGVEESSNKSESILSVYGSSTELEKQRFVDDVKFIQSHLNSKDKKMLDIPPDQVMKNENVYYTKDFLYGEILMVDNVPVSNIEVFRYEDEMAGVGLVTRSEPRYRRKGYASKLVNDVKKWFDNQTEYKVLSWDVAADNIPSQKLAEKCGFIKTNLKYKYKDTNRVYYAYEYVTKGSDMYYRVTYNGIGIYEAFRVELLSKGRHDVWKDFLNSPNSKWLPKPPEYKGNNKSYFTEKGFKMFSKKTLPMMKKYLNPDKINIETVAIQTKIVYRDEYQIVTEEYSITTENLHEVRTGYINGAEESVVTENFIFSKNNLYINFDKFESGKSNICLVTGLSGSGKSTLAKSLASKYKAEWIELDMFECCYSFETDEQLKEAGEVFYEYLSNHKTLWDMLKNRQIKGKALGDECKRFFEYCISWCRKHKENKWVIEGVQIYSFADPSKVKSIPTVFVNASMLKSITQRWKRNGDGKINLAKELKDEFPQMLSWYIDNEREFNSFQKAVLNETPIRESAIPDEYYSDKFSDAQTVFNTLSEREAMWYVGRQDYRGKKSYVDAPVVKYRRTLIKNQIPVGTIEVRGCKSIEYQWVGVFIGKDYRHQGYSKILFNHMLDDYKPKGKIRWHVEFDNKVSQHTAESLGFKQVPPKLSDRLKKYEMIIE